MKTFYQYCKVTSLLIYVSLIPFSTSALGQTTDSYPPEVVESFMDGCTSNGGDEALCACVIEGVESEFSLEEFAQMIDELEAGNPSDDFTNIVEFCAAGGQPNS